MSARFQESFDWMPLGASAAQIGALMNMRGWYFTGGSLASGSCTTIAPGRFGYGQALEVGSLNFTFVANRPIGYQNSAGGFVYFPFMRGAANNGGVPFVGVFDAVNNVVLCCFSFHANGIVKAWRGYPPTSFGAWEAAGTLLGASEPGAFLDQVWQGAECFFKVNGTTGEMECRIDTLSVLHLINVDTQPGSNAYFDSICFGHVYDTNTFALYYGIMAQTPQA